jgi:hypothetical protein
LIASGMPCAWQKWPASSAAKTAHRAIEPGYWAAAAIARLPGCAKEC